MFTIDKPLENFEDDILCRKNFSTRLGDTILHWKESDNLVIGLYGKWGEGKSSIINLIRKHLNTSQGKPIIIEFNPWEYSDDNNLSYRFFQEIASKLEISQYGKLAKLIEKYGKLLSLIPEAEQRKDIFSLIALCLGMGGYTLGSFPFIKTLPRTFFSIIGFFSLLFIIVRDYLSKNIKLLDKKPISLPHIKSEINIELKKTNKHLLIIIDDIDRLNKSEIKELFKLVKMNADFPNTTYLLAFDHEVIAKNLNDEQVGISGNEFLKKIVQVNYKIPHVQQYKIKEYLQNGIVELLKNYPSLNQDVFSSVSFEWNYLYSDSLHDCFHNIRDVKSYLNSLQLNFKMLCNRDVLEVNFYDFIVIEAIRVFFPAMYTFVSENKILFTSFKPEMNIQGFFTQKRVLYNKLIKSIPKHQTHIINRLIFFLFPQAEYTINSGEKYFDSTALAEWQKNLRICVPNCFDAYFTFIPGGDENEITQYDLERLIIEIQQPEQFQKSLQTYNAKGKLYKALERLAVYIPDFEVIKDKDIIGLLSVLFNMSDQIIEQNPFGFKSLHIALLSLIESIVSRSKELNFNTILFESAFSNSLGIFAPAHLLSNAIRRNNKGETPILLNPEKFHQLKKNCTDRLASKSLEFFVRHSCSKYLFHYWKSWDESDSADKMLKKLWHKPESLLIFFKQFLNKRYVDSSTDRFSKSELDFNYNLLKEFYELESCKNMLEEIEITYPDLNEEHKQTIAAFLDNYHDRDNPDYNSYGIATTKQETP